MQRIKKMIADCPELMDLLALIQSFGLKDAWLCAGTLRNYIWNQLDGKALVFSSDIDLVFYDPELSYEQTLAVEKEIKANYPTYNWEVKNEVYMHVHTLDAEPYLDARDAISKFPERCTAIAARLDDEGELELFLPFGEEVLLNFRISPTPFYQEHPGRMVDSMASLGD